MNYSQHSLELQNLKQDFLRGLGVSSDEELIANLDQAFLGDNYQQNTTNLFKRFYQEKLQNNPNQNFLQSLQEWSKEKLDENFDSRFAIAIGNSSGLVGAFLLNFFLTPIAGIACAVGVSGVSAIAESQAKRNIANIGHLSSHFTNKLQSAIQELRTNFQKEFGEDTKFSEHKSKDKSGIFRILSYFSSTTVSGTEKTLTRFSPIADSISFALSAVVGSILPILPMLNYGLAKKSANLRQDRFEKVVSALHDTIDKIFVEVENNPNIDKEKLQNLLKKFAENLRSTDSHGKILSTSKTNKDKVCNPSKIISSSSWFLSKIRRPIKNIFGTKAQKKSADEDLTILDENFSASSHQYDSFKEKPITPIAEIKTSQDEVRTLSHPELDLVLKSYQSPDNFRSSSKTQLKYSLKPIYKEGESPEEMEEIRYKKWLIEEQLHQQERDQEKSRQLSLEIAEEKIRKNNINKVIPSYIIFKEKFDINFNPSQNPRYLEPITPNSVNEPSQLVKPKCFNKVKSSPKPQTIFFG